MKAQWMGASEVIDEAVPVGVDEAKSKRWAVWHHQFDLVRAEDGVRYLRRRWLVKTPMFGIALHRMDGPDARDTLHDHPFSFVSLVLRGGYIERRLRPLQRSVDEQHVVTRVNYMRAATDAHTITHLLRVPTWTLVICGPYVRTWGFWEPPRSYKQATTLPASVTAEGFAWRHIADSYWRWTKHDAFDSGHYVPTTKET